MKKSIISVILLFIAISCKSETDLSNLDMSINDLNFCERAKYISLHSKALKLNPALLYTMNQVS